VISVFNEMPIPTVAVEYQRPVRNLLPERAGIFCQRMESEAIDGVVDELRSNVLIDFTLDIYISPRSSFTGKSFRKKGKRFMTDIKKTCQSQVCNHLAIMQGRKSAV
jgi:hypothetical protein